MSRTTPVAASAGSISVAYVRFGRLPWMQAPSYGIGAAVIGIIARSAHRLTRLTFGRNARLRSIFGVMASATAWTEREIVWFFLLAGVWGLVDRRRWEDGLTGSWMAMIRAAADSGSCNRRRSACAGLRETTSRSIGWRAPG